MTLNIKWNCLVPILSSLVKYYIFKPENVSYYRITTVPRLFSEHLLQKISKHQIMNVNIKWNCFIPILSSIHNAFDVNNISLRHWLMSLNRLCVLSFFLYNLDIDAYNSSMATFCPEHDLLAPIFYMASITTN